MRVEYICNRCGKLSYDSLVPCIYCGYTGGLTVLLDLSPVSRNEVEWYMHNTPAPWPLDKIFIPEPFHYLSLEQLRLVFESRKKGRTVYVLGE